VPSTRPSSPRPPPSAAAARAAPGERATRPDQGTAALVEDWEALVQAAGITGAMRNLADHCALVAARGNRIELVLAKDKTNFNTDNVRGRLQTTLGEYLGREVKLVITLGDPPQATPAERRRANEDERLRATREALEQDPTIKAVQAAFDAVLEPDSIQPAQQERRGRV
jgi:DNA polymerase-3 subunit gamma/tau